MTKPIHFKILCKQGELKLNAIMWENSHEDIFGQTLIFAEITGEKKDLNHNKEKKQHLKVKFYSHRVAVRSYYIQQH